MVNPQVIYRSHPSWHGRIMLLYTLKALAAILLVAAILIGLVMGEVIPPLIGYLGVAGFAIGVLVLLSLLRKTTVYTVTNRSVRLDKGILRRFREEYGINKIQSIDVQQTIIERFILKTGSVYFDTAAGDVGHGNREIRFEGVGNPHRVADMVRNADSGYYDGTYSPAYQQLRDNESRPPSPLARPEYRGDDERPY